MSLLYEIFIAILNVIGVIITLLGTFNTWISTKTVRNRLAADGLYSHRPYQTVIANIMFSEPADTVPGKGRPGGRYSSQMSPDLHCPKVMAACVYTGAGMSETPILAYYNGTVFRLDVP